MSNPKFSPPKPGKQDEQALFAALDGTRNRRALSRAITALETGPATQLNDLLFAWKAPKPTFRLAVSGTPGVGKSTFIEAFGQVVLGQGHHLAVLAVDPSSAISGGSILGDKTRMEILARHPSAFIRPSPTGGHLGGTEANSRAAIVACEAAGFDYIILETVGVGQAEFSVHGMTDAFLLLTQPAAGDELQGIKRGILELADLIVVNKTDLLPKEAELTARQLRQSLHLAPPRPDGWTVQTLLASAATGEGIPDIQKRVSDFRSHGGRDRQRQRLQWVEERFRQEIERSATAFLALKSEHSDRLSRFIDEAKTLSALTDVLLAEFIQKHSQQ